MKSQKETTQKVPSQVPVSSGTGRRKSAVARVWLRKGKGNMTVNGLPHTQYFDTELSRQEATTLFRVTPEALRFDVDVNVSGGGKEAQADAVRLGFSRALVLLYENLRVILREHGLLTVDQRVKERKKYGQPGARRKFQFVKR